MHELCIRAGTVVDVHTHYDGQVTLEPTGTQPGGLANGSRPA